MRLLKRGLSVTFSVVCVLGLAGCQEDNEAFIKQQAANAKNMIPGSRTAQAQTEEEYYQITPGARGGAGTKLGPVPDQGSGYPAPR